MEKVRHGGWKMMAALALGAMSVGCARRDAVASEPPVATRTVVAEPTQYREVYVDEAYVYEEPPADTPDAVGYEELSSGDDVRVVQYVHTYPEPIETFPRVYWSNRWYYNVHGDFVFWDPMYGGWAYYWGPPAPLVTYWNFYYPWAPYSWGVGVYGPSWYWGGVGAYGFHGYGLAVTHHHHHHFHHYRDHAQRWQKRYPKAGTIAKAPGKGGPIHEGSPGALPPKGSRGGPSAETPTKGDNGAAPRRGNGEAPRRSGGIRADAPTRVTAGGDAPTRVTAGGDAPGRGSAGKARLVSRDPTGVERGEVPARLAAQAPARDPRARRNVEMTTSGGQRITSVAAPGASATPRRTHTVDSNGSRSRTVGRVPAAQAPQPSWSPDTVRAPMRDPFRGNASTSPSRSGSAGRATVPARGRATTPSSSPSRSAPTYRAPTRSTPPSRTPTYRAPTRSAPPSYSPPSRSPSRSAPPSRSPSRSAPPSRSPSRSYSPPSRSPSRSYSPPSRSRSMPSRSMPSRSRSMPSRSMPSRSRSMPSRSAPSRGGRGRR